MGTGVLQGKKKVKTGLESHANPTVHSSTPGVNENPSRATKAKKQHTNVWLPSSSSSDPPPALGQHRTYPCRQSTGWPHPRWGVWTRRLWLQNDGSSLTCHRECSIQHQQLPDNPEETQKRMRIILGGRLAYTVGCNIPPKVKYADLPGN